MKTMRNSLLNDKISQKVNSVFAAQKAKGRISKMLLFLFTQNVCFSVLYQHYHSALKPLQAGTKKTKCKISFSRFTNIYVLRFALLPSERRFDIGKKVAGIQLQRFLFSKQ